MKLYLLLYPVTFLAWCLLSLARYFEAPAWVFLIIFIMMAFLLAGWIFYCLDKFSGVKK